MLSVVHLRIAQVLPGTVAPGAGRIRVADRIGTRFRLPVTDPQAAGFVWLSAALAIRPDVKIWGVISRKREAGAARSRPK